jgi:Tfp pilus assembly protein PilO
MLPLKRNLTLVIFLLILSIFLLISLFYLGKTVKENTSLNALKNKKLSLINRFSQMQPFPPSQTLLEYYEQRKEKVSEYYKSFHTLFVSSWNKMPNSTPEPLKFKEKLFKSQSKIIKKAKGRGLVIEEAALYLGFDRYETEIPLADDIPDLMVELQAIEELTLLMMQSKVQSLERVRILEPQNETLNSEKHPFVRIFPIRVSIEAGFENFAKFLSLCGKSDFIFVFSDMHIYQGELEKKTIKADILLNLIVFS